MLVKGTVNKLRFDVKVRILYFHGMYRSVPHFVQVKFKPLTVDVKLRRVKFSLFKQAANGGITTILCYVIRCLIP